MVDTALEEDRSRNLADIDRDAGAETVRLSVTTGVRIWVANATELNYILASQGSTFQSLEADPSLASAGTGVVVGFDKDSGRFFLIRIEGIDATNVIPDDIPF